MTAPVAPPLRAVGAELAIARGIAWALGLTALPVVGAAALLRGAPGALGAAAGLGLAAVAFVVAALCHALACRVHPSSAIAVMVGGLALRMVAYLVGLGALAEADGLHRPSLALATAAGIAVALTHEMRLLQRMPELFRLRTPAARRSTP